MLKAGRIQWVLLALVGLLLIPVCMLNGVGGKLAWVTPTVQAGGRHIDRRASTCSNTHTGPSFGSTVVIDAKEVVCGDLTAFGGTVEIEGQVHGNIIAFHSNVVIGGTVNGNVHLYSGSLTLQRGSQFHGALHLYGTSLHRENGILFDGQTIDDSEHIRSIFRDRSEFSFPLWSILTWIALGLLLTSLLPEHVMFVRATAASKTRRSLIIGLLSILLAPAVLIVLIALILPIPLAIIVALGLIAAWALGTVAIGWWVGERIMHMVAPHQQSRPIHVIVGLTALVLVGSLPYIGWLITVAVGLLGLGAVFLSRFGTRLYSQPRRPLSL